MMRTLGRPAVTSPEDLDALVDGEQASLALVDEHRHDHLIEQAGSPRTMSR